MKKLLFFPRIALLGIRKNRKLYLPYLFSCIGMVSMFYIVQSISYSPLLRHMKGGGNVEAVLTLGKFVIAIFALIFLFYTNSFLIRRRYKEFGLYSILGMGRGAVRAVVLCESLFVWFTSSVCGIGIGIGLSKLAELGLLNAIRREVDYRFTVNAEAILLTFGIFAAIFALILVKSLVQVSRAKPLELLRSENSGEKPPKANWLPAFLGVLLLGGGYYIALTTKSPLKALLLFFVAVILVILGTYLLFIAGSVALCRLLQKNKKFYYKKYNFVSVSSMTYRMKRNGAGLASICILCAMTLVMLTFTCSLYFGADDTIGARFPRENEIALQMTSIDRMTGEYFAEVRESYEKVFAEYGVKPENVTEFGYLSTVGTLDGSIVTLDPSAVSRLSIDYDDLRWLYFIEEDEYNRQSGRTISLEKGQALLSAALGSYGKKSIDVGSVHFEIVGEAKDYPQLSDVSGGGVASLLLVVSDFDELLPEEEMISCLYDYSYDLKGQSEKVIEVFHALCDSLRDISFLQGGYGYSSGCFEMERDDFFSTYGGLFFISIILGIVFVFAAAMIIYYKQVSEGYEDAARFSIMRKVGMTARDIRSSVNAQVLTVFFAPLCFAGIHLAFSLPILWQLLQLFGLNNHRLMLIVTGIAFVAFAAFYALLYKATARAYYAIVSSDKA